MNNVVCCSECCGEAAAVLADQVPAGRGAAAGRARHLRDGAGRGAALRLLRHAARRRLLRHLRGVHHQGGRQEERRQDRAHELGVFRVKAAECVDR